MAERENLRTKLQLAQDSTEILRREKQNCEAELSHAQRMLQDITMERDVLKADFGQIAQDFELAKGVVQVRDMELHATTLEREQLGVGLQKLQKKFESARRLMQEASLKEKEQESLQAMVENLELQLAKKDRECSDLKRELRLKNMYPKENS